MSCYLVCWHWVSMPSSQSLTCEWFWAEVLAKMDPPSLYEFVSIPLRLSSLAKRSFSSPLWLLILIYSTHSFRLINTWFCLGNECAGTSYSSSFGRCSGLRDRLQERRAGFRTKSCFVYSSFWIGRCQSDQSPRCKFLFLFKRNIL